MIPPPRDDVDQPFSLKPLMAMAIHEAVKWALVDSVCHPSTVKGESGPTPTDEEREEWLYDVYKIPSECMAEMDPLALAKNIVVRLMGQGGFEVNGIYSGNATPREILEALIHRPDEDPNGDVKNWLQSIGTPDT